MTPDRWNQINELFHAAVALDPQQRDDYLAEVCGADSGLRKELENLVAGHESAQRSQQTALIRGAVQQMAGGEDDEPAVTGQDFGPYRVIREIGRGGMGRVFLAERADHEFNRRVAIKLIKRGMD